MGVFFVVDWLGRRSLRGFVFESTSNTIKIDVERVWTASWGPYGATLGVIFGAHLAPNTMSCGLQVTTSQQTADGHADL